MSWRRAVLGLLGCAGLCSLGVVFSSADARAEAAPRVDRPSAPAEPPQASDGCTLWIIRTFSGHGSRLKKLLNSVIAQRNQNWVAALVNTDSAPFPGMAGAIANLRDRRIYLFSERAATKFTYIDAGYKATDEAVQYFARKYTYGQNIRWLVVTNGDNYYNPDFLSLLDPAVDVVGVDFFSRWDDFSLEASAASSPQRCKLNTFQRGMTDLGSNVWNFRRWLAENITFSQFTPDINESTIGRAPGSLRRVLAGALASQDGQMAEFLVHERGWAAKVVHRCLFSHSPNPWECKQSGGVWLDSPLRAEAECMPSSSLGKLEREESVKVKRQRGDFPDFARFTQNSNHTRFMKACRIELDIERWVGELSKLVKAGGVTERCPDMCLAPECGSMGALPQKLPCDSAAVLAAAGGRGWSLDLAHYGSNARSPDLSALDQEALRRHFLTYGVKEGRCHRFTHALHGSFTVHCPNISHSGDPPPRGRPGMNPQPNMLARVLVKGLGLRGWA